MRRVSGILDCFLLFAVSCLSQSSSQDRARDSYQRAMAQPDGPQKEALLKESIGSWKSFAAYYALGNLQLSLRRYAEAQQTFQDALAIASGAPPMAAAYFKLGLAREGQGDPLEGIAWLEASLSHAKEPMVEQELKRMRLATADRTQTAGAISRALILGKSLGAAPKVDLQVNFEFNRSDLTASGKSQSEELGKLLEQLDQGYQLIFIGHTDEVGSDEYNQKLSLDRAESVKRYIVERYSIASTRIKSEGHGRREPLYTGTSDENNRLNRRVEVRMVTK